MGQSTQLSRKEALYNFFPSAGSALKQKPGPKNVGVTQNNQQNSLNTMERKKVPENKLLVEKAVYTTHTQEISFEEFLKSKHKKPGHP